MATTKDIRVSTAHTACDVCGRTLLRGERAEIYLDGGARRSVCELCKSRALHEGWIREGTVPTYDADSAASARRGSFLSRFRRRRERSAQASAPPPPEPAPPEPAAPEPAAPEPAAPESAAPASRARQAPAAAAPDPPLPERAVPQRAAVEPAVPEPAAPPRRGLRRRARPAQEEPAPRPALRRKRARELKPGAREPRHVRAVPMSAEQKMASAVEVFNNSEHRRTVAGVARSLGAPAVSVHPNAVHPSVVQIVASWELCWYRYEVDLSDEVPVLRVAAQGYELDELGPQERQPNASYDEHGALGLPGAR
jgi:hypothetical protein